MLSLVLLMSIMSVRWFAEAPDAGLLPAEQPVRPPLEESFGFRNDPIPAEVINKGRTENLNSIHQERLWTSLKTLMLADHGFNFLDKTERVLRIHLDPAQQFSNGRAIWHSNDKEKYVQLGVETVKRGSSSTLLIILHQQDDKNGCIPSEFVISQIADYGGRIVRGGVYNNYALYKLDSGALVGLQTNHGCAAIFSVMGGALN